MTWYNPKIKLLNSLSLSKRKGFTLVELLIAFLVVALSISVALQGMALASLAQIRARERAEATLAIQRNLELIRNVAATYLQPIPNETDEEKEAREEEMQVRCNATDATEGMAAGLKDAINDNLDLPQRDDRFMAAASSRPYVFNPDSDPIVLDQDNPNILQIRYWIADTSTDNVIVLADLSTEVSPDVSLQCQPNRQN